MKGALAKLMGYRRFHWGHEQTFSERDGERIKTFFDDATRTGRLTTGHWYKKTWACFITVSYMIQKFLNYNHDHGCQTWDVVLYKCFSIVLVTSLGCRAGDVGQTRLYAGVEYLKWKDVRLTLEGEPLDNLYMEVVLQYQKNHKDKLNEESIFRFKPLTDPESRNMCPIALMMVHVLRHGLVEATTLDQLLKAIHETPDLSLRWTFPDYPVLTAMANADLPFRCLISKPAPATQLLHTIKYMGLLSNILQRTVIHATRYGGARNRAHLPPPSKNESFGFVNETHRQSMGHAGSGWNTKMTEEYSGGHSFLTYNAIAENKNKRHRREAKFGSENAIDLVRAPITAEEVEDWHERHDEAQRNLSQVPKNKRRRAVAGVQRERLEAYKQSASPVADPHKEIILETKASSTPLRTLNASEINGRQSSLQPPESPVSTEEFDPHLMNIDPQVINLDQSIDAGALDDRNIDDFDVDQSAFNSLQTTILPVNENNDPTSPEEDESDQNVEEAAKVLTTDETSDQTSEMWIDYHSRINVIFNNSFADNWRAYSERGEAFEDTIARFSTSGNSRDSPTPYIWSCTKTPNCTYRTIRPTTLRKHEQICTEDGVAAILQGASGEIHACKKDGCDDKYPTEAGLLGHVRDIHDWTPRKCDDCSDDVLYDKGNTYRHHRQVKHSLTSRFPVSCRFPGCTTAKQFPSMEPLQNHLRKVHGINDKNDMLDYLPPIITLEFRRQACPLGCLKYFTRGDKLDNHMVAAHEMSKQDARAFVQEKAVWRPIKKPAYIITPYVRLRQDKSIEF